MDNHSGRLSPANVERDLTLGPVRCLLGGEQARR